MTFGWKRLSPVESKSLTGPSWPLWLLRFGVPFLLLNALLTFENALPGIGIDIGIRHAPRLSFELCVMVAALMAWTAWRGVPARGAASLFAAGFMALALVRYLDVTVPAVFGRPVNVYWDGRHAFDALQLALAAVPVWQIALGVLAVLVGLVAAFRATRWAIGVLAESLAFRRAQPWLALTIGALVASYAAYEPQVRDTRWFFSLPVTPTLVRQASLVAAIVAGHDRSQALGSSPAFTGNVAALKGADVVLVFAESYGMTTFDDPAKAAALASSRTEFAQAIASTGRHVVSARVRSPTFAGGSWLAHAALLSGIDTRDPGTYDVLLTSQRPSLVRHFASHGYRTVGWMPGLQKPWPEGSFYGYDRIAGADAMGYAGLDFGYWRIPDQAAIALLADQELGGAKRAPRFVVFPTLGTHVPFRPLAPYLADWSGVTSPGAWSAKDLLQAMAVPVTWQDAVPAYVASLRYQFQWLGGFLEQRAPRHMLMIVIGDHQPLAAVSGKDASWDVPIHVISDDPALLAHFARHGFTQGLTPSQGVLSTMSELTTLLLEILDDPSG